MADATTYEGSCLCGRVQFKVQAEPKHVTRCHCWNCRKHTGCAFQPNLVFADAAVKISCGEDKRQVYGDGAQTSGDTLYRHFCGICGSHLFVSYRADTGVIDHGSLSSGRAGEGGKDEPELNAAVFYGALDYRIRHVGDSGEEVRERIEEPPSVEFHVRDRLGWVEPLAGAKQVWTKPGREDSQ